MVPHCHVKDLSTYFVIQNGRQVEGLENKMHKERHHLVKMPRKCNLNLLWIFTACAKYISKGQKKFIL